MLFKSQILSFRLQISLLFSTLPNISAFFLPKRQKLLMYDNKLCTFMLFLLILCHFANLVALMKYAIKRIYATSDNISDNGDVHHDS